MHLTTKECQTTCHAVNHTEQPNSEVELDGQGKHPHNWIGQENSGTAFGVARDKMSRMKLAFQTLESQAGILTGFLATILASALGFMATGQPLRRDRQLGPGQAGSRICREVLRFGVAAIAWRSMAEFEARFQRRLRCSTVSAGTEISYR
jgi:hypothetical protein